jgi:eukaryotic-like serine/threonine-protein kinase
MDDESDKRWRELEELVAKLEELDSSARPALLDEVCRDDPELRAELEQLIESNSAPAELSDPASRVANSPAGPTLSEGEILAERFRIVRLLGKGGMGEVYEAADLVLKTEHLALKTLPTGLAADEDAIGRLNRELQLARRITHPNVCRVHDVYHHRPPSGARIVFFTMELLPGETLADRLRRGPMTTADALPVATQMAAAIDAAHQADVVHGDFKPGNVMLVASGERERVVVTDFGLARWRPAGSTLLSTTIGRFGTPAYMAPELALGGGVTRATDVYAFGVVLYEMLTGHRPYPADSPLLLAVRKLRHPPRPPREYVGDLDLRWEAVILRCLDADPEKRFRSAAEAIKTLERQPRATWPWAPVAATLVCIAVVSSPPARDWVAGMLSQISSLITGDAGGEQGIAEQAVALLPFTHDARTADDQAFSLGLTAAVTDRLGTLSEAQRRLYFAPAAQVIDTGVDTPGLVRQTLGATLIITGSLGTLSDGTRLVIELNDMSRDAPEQRDIRTVDCRPGDAELMIDKVATAITQMLGMSPPSADPPRRGPGLTQRRAEEAYLRGRGYLLQGPRGVASAITAFQQAIQEDNHHAVAYAALSEAYLGQYDATKDVESLRTAGTRIDEAIALDPLDADAHVIRGRVYLATSQYQRAIFEFQHALKIDPEGADARNRLAAAYEAQGAVTMAEAEYRKSIALHPRYWSGYEDLGTFLYRQGRYNEAEQNYVMGAGYAPANRRAIANLAAVYEIQGRFLAAENELIRGLKLSPDAILYNNLAWVLILEGKFDAAVEAMREAVKQPGADSIVWSGLARAYRWAGTLPKAERSAYETALERADEELRVNPLNAEVRANRAYLLAETGRRGEALKEIAAVLASEQARGRVTVLFRSALVHEKVGDRRGALEALELAARGGYPMSRIAHDPDLEALRNDPRYQRVVDVAGRGGK